MREVAAAGSRPLATTSSVASDVYVATAQYSWSNGQAVINLWGAAENDPSSAQASARDERRMTALGQLVEQSRIDRNGIRVERSRFGLDRLGHAAVQTRFKDPVNATGAATWTQTFDSRGLVRTTQEPGVATVYNSYDDWGELTSTMRDDINGVRWVTRSTYDGFGRPTSTVAEHISIAWGVVTVEKHDTYAYDTHSGSVHQPPGDFRGLLSRVTTTGLGDEYLGYDSLGRQTSDTYWYGAIAQPEGTTRTFTPGGALTELDIRTPAGLDQITYTHDSAGRVRRVTDEGAHIVLFDAESLDAKGRYRRVRLGNGVIENFDYSGHGLDLLTHWSAAGASWVRHDNINTRDAAGRVLGESYTLGTSLVSATNSYDVLGRLRAAYTSSALSQPAQNEQFTYDALGNLTTKGNTTVSGQNRTYTYDTTDLDRLSCFTPTGGTGGCGFTYNESGNVTRDTWNGTRTFTYDAASRITRITKSPYTGTFQYGPGGRLAREEVMNGPTLVRRIWMFGDLIEQRTRPDGVTQTERRIPGPLGIIATKRTEHTAGAARETVYVHGDPRGNRFFSRADGTVPQEVRYRAYGGVIADTGAALPSSLTYTDDLWNGGDDLRELGVDLLGARIYDPTLGRFLQRDPLMLSGSASQSNPYAFAFGDPVNLSDPSGMCPGLCITKSYDPSFDLAIAVGAAYFAFTALDSYAAAGAQTVLNGYLDIQRNSNLGVIDAFRDMGASGKSVADNCGGVSADSKLHCAKWGADSTVKMGKAILALSQAFQKDPIGTAIEIRDTVGHGSWVRAAARLGTPILLGLIDPIAMVEMFEVAVQAKRMGTLAEVFVAGKGGGGAFLEAEGGIGVAGGAKPFAMGLTDQGLDAFAKARSATTWKQLPDVGNWKGGVLDKLADPNTMVHFNLDGVDAWQGVSRAAAAGRRAGPTDWELLTIQQNPQFWKTIQFWKGGQPVPNPFQ